MEKQWKWDTNPCDYDPEQYAPWLVDENDIPILWGAVKCRDLQSANLIAAAPKLLEALLKVELKLLDIERAFLLGGDGEYSIEPELLQARAAIAKANGQCLKGEE